MAAKKVQETSLGMVTVYFIFKINFSKLTANRNCCHAKIFHNWKTTERYNSQVNQSLLWTVVFFLPQSVRNFVKTRWTSRCWRGRTFRVIIVSLLLAYFSGLLFLVKKRTVKLQHNDLIMYCQLLIYASKWLTFFFSGVLLRGRLCVEARESGVLLRVRLRLRLRLRLWLL